MYTRALAACEGEVQQALEFLVWHHLLHGSFRKNYSILIRKEKALIECILLSGGGQLRLPLVMSPGLAYRIRYMMWPHRGFCRNLNTGLCPRNGAFPHLPFGYRTWNTIVGSFRRMAPRSMCTCTRYSSLCASPFAKLRFCDRLSSVETKIGIVGLPNVGKSTLFNALTKKGVPMENYPFCTIDPSVGVVAVPDSRVNALAEFSKSKKKVPAAIEFVDIAGLVKGASQGKGLGNKFLSNIREVDAIAHVVRCFEDSAVIHVENKLDPEDDIATIKTELELADLEMIEKHKAKMREKGKEEQKLQLLADKPVLYVLNVTHIGDNKIPKIDGVTVEVDATSGEDLDKLISKSYELLGLMSYFTTGEDETRAWTIKVGSTAPEAGAAIHTDFKDKFIRAEVVSYDDLMKSGSYARARELGLVRTEGRDYVVKDGDIIEFKI